MHWLDVEAKADQVHNRATTTKNEARTRAKNDKAKWANGKERAREGQGERPWWMRWESSHCRLDHRKRRAATSGKKKRTKLNETEQ